ncbi:MAG: hypothetical protein ACRDYU_09730 [Actinomycetes bacterium]
MRSKATAAAAIAVTALTVGAAVAVQEVVSPPGDSRASGIATPVPDGLSRDPGASVPEQRPSTEPAPPTSSVATSSEPESGRTPDDADRDRPDSSGSGFPDASTTGVPDGVELTPAGSVTITVDGAVFEGKDFGCVTVAAHDVVIRESRVTCARTEPSVYNKGRNLLVEDVEIDGTGDGEVAIGFSNYTARRVDIHGSEDGVKAESDTRLEDSYIHHLARQPGSHGDAVQTSKGSGIRIIGNTLQAYNTSTGDLMNAAWMVSETFGPVSDAVFAHNLVNGGNYTINGEGSVVVRGNTFGRRSRYGPISLSPDVSFERSNVWADNGRPVAN